MATRLHSRETRCGSSLRRLGSADIGPTPRPPTRPRTNWRSTRARTSCSGKRASASAGCATFCMTVARLVGVVIHPDGWWEHDVVLQVRFLERSDDLALFAHLTDRDVERLQPFLTGESEK